MAEIQISEGATVKSPGGEVLGKVDRFVVNPATAEVTHLVIRKGVFFPEDRVVSVDAIAEYDQEDATLTADVAPQELPPFEEPHYVEADADTTQRLDYAPGAAWLWRYPIIYHGVYPRYPVGRVGAPEEGMRQVRRLNIPSEGVLVDEDTPVVSSGGDVVGRVAEVYVDESGELSHLVVDLGMLEGERVLPAHWIESVREDQVGLAVGEAALERLEPVGS